MFSYSFLTMINEIDDSNKRIRMFLANNKKWNAVFKVLCWIPAIHIVFGIALSMYLYIGTMKSLIND